MSFKKIINDYTETIIYFVGVFAIFWVTGWQTLFGYQINKWVPAAMLTTMILWYYTHKLLQYEEIQKQIIEQQNTEVKTNG
jgi:hypothetical protein